MLAQFVERVNTSGIAEDSPAPVRGEVLDALKALTRGIELSEDERAALPDRYVARLLHADPSGWSLVEVVLPPGHATPPHDHESWGCAATVRGVERNRFLRMAPHGFEVIEECEFRRGEGYIFNEGEIHSPLGADPEGVTLSLHLLVRGLLGREQQCMEGSEVVGLRRDADSVQ